MKFSKQRELILNEVLNSHIHLTADNIYENLKKNNPNLSLGTVYRNLTQLEEHGLISKLSIPGDPVRFDRNIDDHNHFICESCGAIIDIDFDSVKYESKNGDSANMKVNSSYIILKGLCSKCNK